MRIILKLVNSLFILIKQADVMLVFTEESIIYMSRMKRAFFICMLCMAFVICGCNTEPAQKDDKITIVCTNFPLYDWTRQILGENDAEVILLLDNGTDMHSFQPSAEELIQIADCDMLVHVGGESDAWLMDALNANPNEERIVVNLMEALEDDLKEEVYAEGMQAEHTHEDGSVCDVDHDEAAMDEHVWLSLKLAVKSCEAVENALCKVLPESEASIRDNADAYCQELLALEQEYENLATEEVILVADRFPFMYLTDDLGLKYYAAFPGCSTESEADFETVVFLAEKVKEYEVDTILITESGTDTLANTVYENAGTEDGSIAVLHSMQVVYNSDIENGCTYLAYMEENLKVLEQVLGCSQ